MLAASIRKTGPLGAKIERLRAERIAAGLIKPEPGEKCVVLISQNGGPLVEERAPDPIIELSVEDEPPPPPPREKIRAIRDIVCQRFGMELTELIGRRRSLKVSRPRQIGMYLSKQLTIHSYPEIGRRFGNRDHTTVMHAQAKIQTLMAADPEFKELVLSIRKECERRLGIKPPPPPPREEDLPFWGS